jgi:hypothetical protein
MKLRSWMIVVCTVFLMVNSGNAEETSAAKVKYSAGKDVNFEELLIQGQLKRPEISVVTGNVKDGANGLLRLRENFLDRVTSDAGEESAE